MSELSFAKYTSMHNPYEPPRSGTVDDHLRSFSFARFAFFAVNFVFSVSVAIWSLVTIVAAAFGGGSPTELLGSILFLTPFSLFSFAEWVAFYRKRGRIERRLGFVMLGCAGFVLFGVAANVWEAIASRSENLREFLVWFVGIGMATCAYCASCGAYRVCPRLFGRNLLPEDNSQTVHHSSIRE